MVGRRLDSSGTGWGPVAVFEHIKLLIKVRGFLEWTSVSGS